MSLNETSRWQNLTSLINDGFYVIQDYRLVYVNPAFAELLGVSVDELIGQRFEQYLAPEIRERVVKNYENRIRGQWAPKHYEMTMMQPKTGQRIDVWLETNVLKDGDVVEAVAGTVRDIRELKRIKKELGDTKHKLNIILENMADTIYQTNMTGDITLISRNVETLLGYREEELVGTKMADLYWTPEERARVVQAIIDNNGVITNVEAILRRKDGSPVWISTNAYVNKNDEGEPISIEGIARDVTRQKELEQRLEKLALTDSLTGIPNRRALMDELHLRFTHAVENKSPLSVIYLDVNGFKGINDQFGHLTGDRFLTHVTSMLGKHVLDGEMFGRLSGDEFLFILPRKYAHQAKDLAEQVMDEVRSKPLMEGDKRIDVSLALGVSELNASDKNEYSLLDRADKAMYQAKNGEMKYQVI